MQEIWSEETIFDKKISKFGYRVEGKIKEALQVLRTAKFIKHEKNYIAHPIRVAEYCLDFSETSSEDLIVLSLLHNILEVADYSPQELLLKFGRNVYEGCVLLTVDRDLQKKDPSYHRTYYQKLLIAPVHVQLVKIMDKLDNLLVLFIQPSEEICRLYLDEIEEYLLPLVAVGASSLMPVFKKLVEENRTWPHQSLEDFLKKNAAT